jgi:hypothetical protein
MGSPVQRATVALVALLVPALLVPAALAATPARRGLADLRPVASRGLADLRRLPLTGVADRIRARQRAHRAAPRISGTARVQAGGRWTARNRPPVYWVSGAVWRAAVTAVVTGVLPLAPETEGGKGSAIGASGRAVGAVEGRGDLPTAEAPVGAEAPPPAEAPAAEAPPAEAPVGETSPPVEETPAEAPGEGEAVEEEPAPSEKAAGEAPLEAGGEVPAQPEDPQLPGASESPALPESPEASEGPGVLLFDGEHVGGESFYLEVCRRERISEVPDPLGSGATVLDFDVLDTDVHGSPTCQGSGTATENPRAMAITPGFIESGDEFWLRTEFLIPEGFPSVPQWLTLVEIFGPPFENDSPWHFQVDDDEFRFQRNATYEFDVPWNAPEVKGRWIELMTHERFGEQGFLEMWVDGKKVEFFATKLRNPRREPESERLEMATMDRSNDEGPNSVRIGQYRKAGMFDEGSIYYRFVKVGTTRESVGG